MIAVLLALALLSSQCAQAARIIVRLDERAGSTSAHRHSVLDPAIARAKRDRLQGNNNNNNNNKERSAPGLGDISIRAEYTSALLGYSLEIPDGLTASDETALRALLLGLDNVRDIFSDGDGDKARAEAGSQSIDPRDTSPGQWALDRVLAGQTLPRASALDGTVRVWILDSGVDSAHREFDAGRAKNFKSCVFATAGLDRDGDILGHGTAVAGIVGGRHFGVAKRVTIKAVKLVSDADSAVSRAAVLCALDAVHAEVARSAHDRRQRHVVLVAQPFHGGRVEDDALAKLADLDSVLVVMTAHGDCPAVSGHESVLVVGSTTRRDRPAAFSPAGKCVDVVAPGTNVVTAKAGGGSQPWSSTSASAALVAGVAAVHLSSGLSAHEAIAAIRDDAVEVAPGVARLLQYAPHAPSPKLDDLGSAEDDDEYKNGYVYYAFVAMGWAILLWAARVIVLRLSLRKVKSPPPRYRPPVMVPYAIVTTDRVDDDDLASQEVATSMLIDMGAVSSSANIAKLKVPRYFTEAKQRKTAAEVIKGATF